MSDMDEDDFIMMFRSPPRKQARVAVKAEPEDPAEPSVPVSTNPGE